MAEEKQDPETTEENDAATTQEEATEAGHYGSKPGGNDNSEYTIPGQAEQAEKEPEPDEESASKTRKRKSE